MSYEEYKEYNDLVLPYKIYNIVKKIEALFEITFDFEEVHYINRGGYAYAKAAGFTYSYCTFSMEDGPDVDYHVEIIKMIKGLGFEIANSHGDNGLDPYDSCGRDTYWSFEFAYIPSRVYLY